MMTNEAGTGEKRSRSESEASGSLEEGRETTRSKRLRLETRTPPSNAVTDDIQTSAISDPYPGQEQGKCRVVDRPHNMTLFSGSVAHADESEEIVITSIRATDVAIGIRRIPVGFYAMVQHSGLEWRTENKRSSTNDDVVEWAGPVPLLSLSAVVSIEIYASFEFQPMLGTGEQLRRLSITVEQLLDRSARNVPFTLFAKDEDIVSPCSSVLVTVERQKRKNNDSSGSRVFGPRSSTARSELEDATNRGHTALSCYRKHGGKRTLERSVQEFELALSFCPLDHPCRAAALSNLGMATFILCQVGDGGVSLEAPLELYFNALVTRPVGHPDRPFTLLQLAAVHLARLERQREEIDATQVEALLHEALELSYTESVENKAATFFLQLHRRREAGPIRVDDQPMIRQDLPSCLTDEDPRISGVRLLQHFERFGNLADLEQAITLLKTLVRRTSIWDNGYRVGIGSLGVGLWYRFQRSGELRDLEDAISKQRDAVELTPLGHPDKPGYLNNLGNSFRARFERLGDMADLEDAILRQRDAVELTPLGHPHKPVLLDNLGSSFRARFERLGDMADLEDAISRQRDAVELTPLGHPDKPSYLDNLGSSFRARFERLGDMADLEDAISRQRDAVELTPLGHPHKPSYLNNLGNTFITRFERLGEVADLEDAISRLRDAVELTPLGHPHKPGRLNSLGNSFRARFERLGDVADLEQAISVYSRAASVSIGSTVIRFIASQKWISCARRVHHCSLLHAYSIAIRLLPQLAWIGLSLTHRYSELTRAADVVREAAAAALDFGLPEKAVQWLEQGRSTVWGELLQLRDSYEELSPAHPDLAQRLRKLSTQLENAGTLHEKSVSTLLEHGNSAIPGESLPSLLERTRGALDHAAESMRQEADKHRTLAIERDKLLHEIRRLPGFERFLLHKEFSQLRALAHSGPVVILNAAETRCDALIVLADVDQVLHVPLPNFSPKRSSDLQTTLKTFLGYKREGKSAKWDVSWESILSPLWKCVVKPVLDALAFSTPGDLSHIFWCPTGPFTFLPIHAAGLYDAEYLQPGHKVFDFVVSSYVPTLGVLAPLSNPSVVPDSKLRLLVVRRPSSDGLSHLSGVATELKYMKEVVMNSPLAHATLLESPNGTVEDVLALMKEADWVHFACHGIQDGVDSGLCLADRRRLSLRDIIALSHPRGGLAFLSACQTAMGDERLSDEAVHIAAGMLFAGYGGVVGTMWSISDALAPLVARGVYGQLFGKGTRPDYREAALALHETIGRLRDSDRVPFDEWIPFIHMGL